MDQSKIHSIGCDLTDDKTKEILERIAHTCPVSLSLHPDLEEEISITWAD